MLLVWELFENHSSKHGARKGPLLFKSKGVRYTGSRCVSGRGYNILHDPEMSETDDIYMELIPPYLLKL